MLAPFTINTPWRFNFWDDGAGKFSITPNLTVTQTQETGTSLEFHLEGTLTMALSRSLNPSTIASSDYFAFVSDNVFWSSFVYADSNVGQALPTALDGPASATDQVVFEVRLDRDIGDEDVKITLWVLGHGVVLDGVSSTDSHTVTLDVTFTRPQPIEVPISVAQTWSAFRSHNQGTRWASQGQYGELTTLPATDYRPSAVHGSSYLLSCNRSGGARRIYTSGGWGNMASDGSTPPSIRNATALVSQQKVGQE